MHPDTRDLDYVAMVFKIVEAAMFIITTYSVQLSGVGLQSKNLLNTGECSYQ